jgi:Tfp pilus assembly protein PilX
MKKNSIIKNQQGIVSLIICLIMIIVVSLIAVGFIQLSSNEQKSALNNQLSQQAYYAADSGINGVLQTIKSTGTVSSQSNCTNAYNLSANSVLSNNYASHPCITVDATPSSLKYSINVGTSQVVPIIYDAIPTSDLSTINFSWNEAGYSQSNLVYSSSTCPTSSIPSYSDDTCVASALQVDIEPTNAANLNTEAQRIYYLFPKHISANPPQQPVNRIDISQVSSGIVNVNCADTFACLTSFTGLNSPGYYIKVMPIYGTKTILTVTATAGLTNVPLSGAQAVVVSTGKAQNVLQSLEAIIDLSGTNPTAPGFAIQSQNSICADQQGGGSQPTSVNNSACNNVEGN